MQALLSMEVRSVSVGACHMAAVIGAGELWAWGSATDGRLGLGPTRLGVQTKPMQVWVFTPRGACMMAGLI